MRAWMPVIWGFGCVIGATLLWYGTVDMAEAMSEGWWSVAATAIQCFVGGLLIGSCAYNLWRVA